MYSVIYKTIYDKDDVNYDGDLETYLNKMAEVGVELVGYSNYDNLNNASCYEFIFKKKGIKMIKKWERIDILLLIVLILAMLSIILTVK